MGSVYLPWARKYRQNNRLVVSRMLSAGQFSDQNGVTASGLPIVYKISRLIDSEKLRLEMGNLGKKTVVEEYSIEANRDLYLNIFNNLGVLLLSYFANTRGRAAFDVIV